MTEMTDACHGRRAIAAAGEGVIDRQQNERKRSKGFDHHAQINALLGLSPAAQG